MLITLSTGVTLSLLLPFYIVLCFVKKDNSTLYFYKKKAKATLMIYIF